MPDFRPDPFAAETIRLCLGALPASAAMFYWIDPAQRMVDVALTGMPAQFADDYASGMEQRDPSNVGRLIATGSSLTQLTRPRPEFSADAQRFHQFLRGYGGADVIDMVFRAGGEAVAGIGVISTQGQGAFTQVALERARAIQRFVEFGLQRHERVGPRIFMRRHGLTPREWEIASLAADGLKNQEIAKRLRLSVHTVKSHLLRVFGKTGCTNRTQLAALLL